MADCLSTLMVDVLGHETFMAHRHDWGSFISTRLGYAHAECVRGIHITLLAIPRRATPPRTPEEQRFQQQLDDWLREETGYSQIMGTRPQTLAYALTDSPVGLAAWIVEKFRRWSDCAGDLDAHFGKDTLLTNLLLYWATGAVGSTFWPYYARLHDRPGRGIRNGPDGVCRTPQGNPDTAAIPRRAPLRKYPSLDTHAGGRAFPGARVP